MTLSIRKLGAVVCLLATLSFQNIDELRAQCSDLAVTCFVVGPSDADVLATDGSVFRDKDTFVNIPYLSSGRPGDASYVAPSLLSRHRDTGTVFGVAEQAQSNAFIFVSAYTKRATGYGPLGPGGIYRVDPSAAPPANTVQWSTIPSAGVDPHNFDQNGDHLTVDYDDAVTKEHIGKTSLGDLEMSLDGSTLYSVNLLNKHLYSLPATGAAPVSSSDLGLITKPAGCLADDFQPFALGVHPVTGLLYIGAICTDESRTSTDGVHGYVLTYNGGFSHVFNFELENYNFLDPTTSWRGWFNNGSAQPLFVDIEFLGDDLVMGFRDRYYDWRYAPNSSTHARGDVLRACKSGAGWILENNGSCAGVAGSGQIWGPGDGEFFDDQISILGGRIEEENSAMGTLATGGATVSASDRIISPINDPTWLVQGGLQYWTPLDGAKAEDYEVFRGSPNGNGGENPVFGKTNGLGDIESDCRLVLLPIELGSINAYSTGSEIEFEWTTLSETNNSGFQVEYAAPGQTFRELAWITGAGTSSATQSYAYTVRDIFPGRNLLRIKQIDFDGSSSYSEIMEVDVNVPKGFVLHNAYPNPFNPSTTIKFAVENSQRVRVDLYDAKGFLLKTLFNDVAGDNQVHEAKIEGGDLPSGIYMVRLSGVEFSSVRTITLVK